VGAHPGKRRQMTMGGGAHTTGRVVLAGKGGALHVWEVESAYARTQGGRGFNGKGYVSPPAIFPPLQNPKKGATAWLALPHFPGAGKAWNWKLPGGGIAPPTDVYGGLVAWKHGWSPASGAKDGPTILSNHAVVLAVSGGLAPGSPLRAVSWASCKGANLGSQGGVRGRLGGRRDFRAFFCRRLSIGVGDLWAVRGGGESQICQGVATVRVRARDAGFHLDRAENASLSGASSVELPTDLGATFLPGLIIKKKSHSGGKALLVCFPSIGFRVWWIGNPGWGTRGGGEETSPRVVLDFFFFLRGGQKGRHSIFRGRIGGGGGGGLFAVLNVRG